MLHLLDENFSRIGSFKTYDEVVDFIHNSQTYHLSCVSNHHYPLAETLDLKDIGWLFVYYKHTELNIIYSCMKEPPIKGIEREAFEQGLDLIEIHHGSPLNPIQFPVMPDLDIESLKKEWCEAYCKAHGYSLIETSNNEVLSESPMTGQEVLMIWLFNSTNRVSSSYKTFEEVCDHFRRVEHLKPIPAGEAYSGDRWDFVYWPHKRLSSLHEHLKDTHFSQAEREAYENELDLIEIFDGRSELADQYIVTPDLDVAGLMREWCFGYAYVHGYTVLETFAPELSQSSSYFTRCGLRGFSGTFQGRGAAMNLP